MYLKPSNKNEQQQENIGRDPRETNTRDGKKKEKKKKERKKRRTFEQHSPPASSRLKTRSVNTCVRLSGSSYEFTRRCQA